MEYYANTMKLELGNLSISHHADYGWKMQGFHFHDAYEIYLSLTDGIQYFVEDRVYSVSKGDLFVFNHEDMHQSVVPKGLLYDRWVLTFLPEVVEGLSTDQTDVLACFRKRPSGFSWRMRLDSAALAQLEGLLQALLALAQTPAPGNDVRQKLVLTEILLLVNRLYHTDVPLEPPELDQNSRRVQAVVQYIQRNLAADLGRTALARRFFVSGSHLAALFRTVTGSSLADYVISRRMNRARELLRTGMAVSEVGQAVGYRNHAHFSRMFKSRVGVTPRDYQNSSVRPFSRNTASIK